MAFSGGSAGEAFKSVGIRISADVKPLQKGITDANKSFGSLVAEANKAGKAASGFGKVATDALNDARKAATGYSTALKDAHASAQLLGGAASKSFGTLAREALAAKKPTDELSKGIGELATKFGLVAGAIGLAKGYFADLFERSKTDAALASIDRLRKTTEEWAVSFRSAIDNIVVNAVSGIDTIADKLGQAWFGTAPTGDTTSRRGRIETNAEENALRKLGYDPDSMSELDRRMHRYDAGYSAALAAARKDAEAYERNKDVPRANAATAQLTAMGLTSAAIARDQGFAGMGKLSPSLLGLAHGIVGDRYGGTQGETLWSGLGQFWGPDAKKTAGGAPARGGQSYGSMLSNWGGQIGLRAGIAGNQLGNFWGESNDGGNMLGGLLGRTGDSLAGTRRDFWQHTFGGKTEKGPDALGAAKDALGSFSSALGASVAASLAAGNMSVKQAFRAAAAEMKALAIKSGVLALFSGVQAIFNPAKAVEAAGYATTAAAAGAAYATLSGLGGGGDGGGGSGGSGGGGGGGGAGGYGGAGGRSQPASYYVPRSSNYDDSMPQNVTINIGVAGDPRGAAVAISGELEKLRQTRRARPESSRVVRYDQ